MLDRSTFPKVLVAPPPSSLEKDFCCHAYSLQVHKNAEVLQYHNEIFADNGIESWLGFPFLAKKGLMERVQKEDEIRDGDIIMYFNDASYLTHSGRIKNGRVTSKWGGRAKNPITGEFLIGDGIWLHQWEDIPAMYRGIRPRAMFTRISDGVTAEELVQGLLEFKDYLSEKVASSM